MEIIITPTDQITTLDGTMCRLWEGVTDNGVPCKVFVYRIAVAANADVSAFDRVLKEQLPPARHVPLSMIL